MNTRILIITLIGIGLFMLAADAQRQKGGNKKGRGGKGGKGGGKGKGKGQGGGGGGGKVKCGKEFIDSNEYICCDGISHAKAWLDDTACCAEFAYNPTIESCCNGYVEPGYGEGNAYGECCGKVSYDSRCYSCNKRKKVVLPLFDWRWQTCCDGNIVELLPNKSCCCGRDVFDPTDMYCCEGEVQPRPDDVPGDCCTCGLSLVDMVIIMDSSESIQAVNWPKMLDFIQDILSEADIDDDSVRVGILTYRHNATVEFHLDAFHNKVKMFRAINNIAYVRGSTNTGLAIETVTRDMFDHRRGDRPQVENVMLVITDGDSDDFGYTIEMARRAKEENDIHMFAVGINLKNLDELNLIASPPAKQNVLEIDNFDHLADLKGRVFNAICTGIIKYRYHDPCGDDYYDSRFEICCNGNPQEITAGDNTECCDQQAYDVRKEICCEGEVNKRKGKNTVCCGQFAQDPKMELCCDFKTVPKTNSNSTECCDIYAYNPNTELCCDGFVSPMYGDKDSDTACCDDFSYDTRCYECINGGRLVPLFDPECQVCCDGVIHNMTIGYSCCCGKEIFKPEKQICCNGVLRKRKKSDDKLCCECGNALVDIGIVLDSSESILEQNWELLKRFLIDLVKGSDINAGDSRFGLITYRHNVTLEFYLDDFLRSANMIDYLKNLPYVRGSTNTGKGLETMRKSLFIPRNGDRIGVPNIAIVITDGRSDDPAYTREQAKLAKAEGTFIYVVGVGLNATQELKDIASPPSDDNVFTSKTFADLDKLEAKIFSVISDNCPQEPKKKLKKPCGKKMYDPRTEVCCEDKPQPMYVSEKLTKCCGKRSYNFKEQMCCENNVVRRSNQKRSTCCADNSYDPNDAMCCYNTTVVPKQGKKAAQCCGLETYDPAEELCCEDQLFKNYGPKGCCGACCILTDGELVSYDTRCYDCLEGELVPLYDCAYQRCCDGKIQNITSDLTCCCGKKAFNPADWICCDDKLEPREDGDDQECCECAKSLLDICFVLDSSESVGITNWVLMEEFVDDLINESVVPQVRFALITYRHNVTLEFKLNKFSKKEDIINAIDNLPYQRGSTNTGWALEWMRKEVFNRQSGDRSSAPNFCILITDGDSDNRDYTIEQAELAKRQGIHIVALGVGLSDMSELASVASEPPKENAIGIKNFKELEKVKERIFFELSNSICPQTPKTRCKVPCGEYFIDENREICCMETPGKRMAGNKTECCDTVAFDPDCFMCCEGELVSRYAGQYTECCCHVAYDSRIEVCCGNQILPKVARGDVTGCCHNKSYDIRTEVCCNMMYVQPSYGENRTECCGDVSYDTACDECTKKNVIIPGYNTETELCCDGVVQEKEFGERSCCCGKKQFDVDKGICCDGNLEKRPPKGEVSCCAKKAYDRRKKICCDGKVAPRMNGYETLCCGKQSFHPDVFSCCDEKLNNKTSPDDNCCCDKTIFDVNNQVCCEGTVYPLVVSGKRESSKCCANMAFNPKKEICCERTVRPLTNGSSTACCGDKAYNTDTQVCEYGNVKKITGSCEGREYNLKKQICCNGWINDMIPKASNYTRCCFGFAYDTRQHVCCCNGFLQTAFAGVNTQCCYSLGYDASTHICCDGQVIEKTVPSADCCCERQSYDSKREICCGGTVKSRCVGLFTKCCGEEAYDPGYMICCNGKLYNRIYGHDTYCCGTEVYTPMLAACCGDKIAYRKAFKIEW